MGLIHDQQVERIRADDAKATSQGLHRGHLHRLRQVHAIAGSDDGVIDAHCFERPVGLVDQLLPMHQDADPIPFRHRLLRDVAEADRFAAASGQREQHALVAQGEGCLNRRYSFFLIVPQAYFHLTLCNR